MSTFSKRTFDAVAYAAARPSYPSLLYRHIMVYADPVLSPKGSRTVLDLGCGPGLSSIPLLEHFDRVIGLDPSAGMIDAAQQRLEQLKLENAKLFVNKTVTFEQGFAEDLSKLEAESVDLVIAGQAAHWFDMPKVYTEMSRVLKPGGTFAFFGYGEFIFLTFPKLTAMVAPFSSEKLGPYWQQPGRSIVESLLDPLPYPTLSSDPAKQTAHDAFDRKSFLRHKYIRIGEPQVQRKPQRPDEIKMRDFALMLKQKWTIDELIAYINTWSSVHAYNEEHFPTGGSVVDDFRTQIWAQWQREFIRKTRQINIGWRMGMMLGKKRAAPS